jgi:hypothetical protein
MLMNKQINRIVHCAIIVTNRKRNISGSFLEINIFTKRSSSSRIQSAVSTQIRAFPSRRIVSKMVAIKKKELLTESLCDHGNICERVQISTSVPQHSSLDHVSQRSLNMYSYLIIAHL